MASPRPPGDRNGFHIAIVCALRIESDAVNLLFDEIFERQYGRETGDTNTYTTGRIGNHAAVLLLLPRMGMEAAAAGARSLQSSYPNIRLALLVGVCGGLPRIGNQDAFLGDVVISKRIINCDLARQYPRKLVVRPTEDVLGQPNNDVAGLLACLEGENGMDRLQRKSVVALATLQARAVERKRKTNYNPPPDATDTIFPADYDHIHRNEDCPECDADPPLFCEPASKLSCDDVGCEAPRRTPRSARKEKRPLELVPQVFMGTFACGNSVMKSAGHRDGLAQEHGVIAFEMEGVGAWKEVPCIVVKGICDYADSHKNKQWQNFAAACAASVAVAILDRYDVPGRVAAGAAEPDRSNQAAINSYNTTSNSHSTNSHNTNSHNNHNTAPVFSQISHSQLNYNSVTISPFSKAAKGDHWLVPRSASVMFTGRTDLIKRIEEAIKPVRKPQHQRRFVITGFGGEGKSEVCLQVANQVRKLFWGVFWVDVSSQESASAGFSAISTNLALGSPGIRETLLYLSRIGRKHRWLLILDNADDLSTDYQQYLPSGAYGSVLVTSRLRDCHSLSTTGWQDLGDLHEEECISLLLKAADIGEHSANDQVGAAQTVRMLRHHTLAIVHAGAYIQQHRCSMAVYQETYDQQRKAVFKFRPRQSQSRYESVWATFEASALVLEQSSETDAQDALELLGVLSELNLKDFPLELFHDTWHGARMAENVPKEGRKSLNILTGWHVRALPKCLQPNGSSEIRAGRFSAALSQLRCLAFIDDGQANGISGISMHPLVHEWMSLRRQADRKKRDCLAAVCTLCLAQDASCRESNGWHVYSHRLVPHVKPLGERHRWLLNPDSPSQPEVQLLITYGAILNELFLYRGFDRLAAWLLHSLDTEQDMCSQDRLHLACLAATSDGQAGKYKESIRILERALKAAENSPGSGPDGNRLEAQVLLGHSYNHDGRHKEAIALLGEVLSIQKGGGPGIDAGDIIDTQNLLAEAWNGAGNPEKAIATLEELAELAPTYGGLDKHKRVTKLSSLWLGQKSGETTKSHPEAMRRQHALGIAYFNAGSFDKGIKLLEEVIRIESRILGETDPRCLCSESVLGHFYLEVGKPAKAAKLLQRVVSVQATTLEEDNPQRVIAETSLARALGALPNRLLRRDRLQEGFRRLFRS